MRELHDRRRERLPSIVWFRAREDEQVAPIERHAPDDELGPGQLLELAVDDLEGSRAEVAALPASTQPSNAATNVGAIRSPGSPGLPGPAIE
jgi:hypothetical protein